MTHSFKKVITLVALTLLTAEARAQPSDFERAHELYNQGWAFYEAGQCRQAIAKYQAAYNLVPLPYLLLALGAAYECLDDRAAAIAEYERCLAATPNEADAGKARQRLAVLRRRPVSPGQPAGPTPGGAPPSATASRIPSPSPSPLGPPAGGKPATPTVSEPAPARTGVDDGVRDTGSVPAAALATAPSPRHDGPRPIYKRPWFWGVLGGAAVVIGVGVGLGVAFGAPRDPATTLPPVTWHGALGVAGATAPLPTR